MNSRDPFWIAKRLGLGYALGLGAYELANADALDVFFGLLLFLPWQVGPAALAAMLAKAARTRVGAWLFVAVEAAVILYTLWLFVDIGVHRDHWNSVGASMYLGFVGPFFQYVAVAAAFLVAYGLGWRAREEWLRA